MTDYNRMVIAGLLCEDTTTGRVRTIAGRPQALYQLAKRDAENLQRGLELLVDMLFAAGAKRIVVPFHRVRELRGPDDVWRVLAEKVPMREWEVVTVHMMGTARMGRDRGASVTDEFGFVHDVDRLMVADASLFPTPIRVKAYYALGPIRVMSNFFILERHRRGFTNYATR